jgi:hypothetical protein
VIQRVPGTAIKIEIFAREENEYSQEQIRKFESDGNQLSAARERLKATNSIVSDLSDGSEVF